MLCVPADSSPLGLWMEVYPALLKDARGLNLGPHARKVAMRPKDQSDPPSGPSGLPSLLSVLKINMYLIKYNTNTDYNGLRQ